MDSENSSPNSGEDYSQDDRPSEKPVSNSVSRHLNSTHSKLKLSLVFHTTSKGSLIHVLT